MSKYISITGLLFIVMMMACKKEESPLIYQSTLTKWDPDWSSGQAYGYTARFNDDSYQISISQPQWYAYSLSPVTKITSTYSLSVDVSIKLTDISLFGYAGLIFNFNDKNNYSVFLISNDGYYQLSTVVNSSTYSTIPWTKTGVIKKGSGVVNTIYLAQNSSSVEIKINNNSIGTFQSFFVSNCKAGLTVHSAYTEAEFTVIVASFTNFEMRRL